MKFIHTSDWHIGRQFHNVSLLEDQQHVLNQLLEYIENEAVDALVIAGDIYDRSVPPAIAVDLLDGLLTKICQEMEVPVILIPGNHDCARRLRFGAQQLSQAGLHILGDLEKVTTPVVIPHADGDVAFYGLPYNDPETVRNLYGVAVSTYDEAHTHLVEHIKENRIADTASVLISHCFVADSKVSDSERPLSIGGSDQVSYQPCVDFDYVALGHLHSPQHRGEEYIRYSGSLMKYSFSEQDQKKGVTLVEVDANGFRSQRHLPLLPLRDLRILKGELATILAKGAVDPNRDDYLLVRLTDRHAILDPMAKLRTVYPNVLQLEKPGMLITAEQAVNRDKLKRGELDMFRDFFEEMSGQKMTEDQDKAIIDVIGDLLKEGAA
jgi:exonuclease SbcD